MLAVTFGQVPLDRGGGAAALHGREPAALEQLDGELGAQTAPGRVSAEKVTMKSAAAAFTVPSVMTDTPTGGTPPGWLGARRSRRWSYQSSRQSGRLAARTAGQGVADRPEAVEDLAQGRLVRPCQLGGGRPARHHQHAVAQRQGAAHAVGAVVGPREVVPLPTWVAGAALQDEPSAVRPPPDRYGPSIGVQPVPRLPRSRSPGSPFGLSGCAAGSSTVDSTLIRDSGPRGIHTVVTVAVRGVVVSAGTRPGGAAPGDPAAGSSDRPPTLSLATRQPDATTSS
jgi:hypothetical protein